MAHSQYKISKVVLPQSPDIQYEIHDAQALHKEDAIAQLTGVFVFKGSKDNEAAVKAITSARAGDVWHATAEGTEWLCTSDISAANSSVWEELGNPFVDTHIHSLSGTVSGSNQASSVSGTATGATTVSTTDIITKATASGTAVGANGTATVVKTYPGATGNLETISVNSAGASVTASKVSKSTSKLATTSLKGVAGTTSVINSVTPSSATISPVSITGVSGSTTASKATAETAVDVAKAGTAISIPNVTANSSVTASKVKTSGTAGSKGTKGTAATWKAEVDNEILTFTWVTNTPTTPTTPAVLPTFESVTATNTTLGTAISVTPAVANGSITPHTFTNVTVPKAASAQSVAALAAATSVVTGIETGSAAVATANASATTVATGSVASDGTGATVVTGVTATDVSAAGPATAVTVANGQVSANGTGDAVLTGLGTPSTATVLTGVKVTAQPTIALSAGTAGTAGHFKTGEDVSTGTTNLAVTGTAAAQTWSGSISGNTGTPK